MFFIFFFFFFFKQKTAYEMRISDWSSDVCSSDLCLNADVVVTRIRLRGGCRDGVLVVDRDALRLGGAHAIWLGGQRIRVRSANELRGRRPWVVEIGRASCRERVCQYV